jgi:hypothetical protein
MKFWSTKSTQRTTKFKQIVLAKHIELHDFDAIFENSWGGMDSRSVYCNGGKESVDIDLTEFNLSLHLTLDTDARHEKPTPDWDAHRPRIFVEDASYPVAYKQSAATLTIKWPGSSALLSSDYDFNENEYVSSDAFDFLRQLFFAPNAPDPVENPRLKELLAKHAKEEADSYSFDWTQEEINEILSNDAKVNLLFAQKAKCTDILHEINAKNIDTYDLSKVNIYHLVPKDKQMTYFWNSLKGVTAGQGRTFEEFFALMSLADVSAINQAWWQDIEASFDFDTMKTTKLVIEGDKYHDDDDEDDGDNDDGDDDEDDGDNDGDDEDDE